MHLEFQPGRSITSRLQLAEAPGAPEPAPAAPPSPPARDTQPLGRDTGTLTSLGDRSELALERFGMPATKPPTFGADDWLLDPGVLRSPADARRDAASVWTQQTVVAGSFRSVERDHQNANALAPSEGINREIEANKELERQALADLSPQQRADYQTIQSQTQQDPDAQLALQLLLIEGTLTDQKNLSSDGKDLLTTVAELGRQPLAEGIDRQALVSDLLQELAAPTSINQCFKGTCTVTSLQIMLAAEHPAEVARLVAGLAAPGGEVTLANGDPLVREPGTEHEDGSGRTISSRLFQAALMEYGNGALDYDNQTDKTDGRYSGLLAEQSARALQGLTGADVQTLSTYPTSSSDPNYRQVARPELVDAVIQQANAGKPVAVGMDWGDRDASGQLHGAHMVSITKVGTDPKAVERLEQELAQLKAERERIRQPATGGNAVSVALGKFFNRDARLAEIDARIAQTEYRLEQAKTEPRVFYNNPWGSEESMPLGEFQTRVFSAHVEPVPPASRGEVQQALLDGMTARLSSLIDSRAAVASAAFKPGGDLERLKALDAIIGGLGEARAAIAAFSPKATLTPEQQQRANQIMTELATASQGLVIPGRRAEAEATIRRLAEELKGLGR